MIDKHFLECIDLYSQNLTGQQQCDWTHITDDCLTKSYIDYMAIFFCSFDDSHIYYGFKFVLTLLWLIYLFVAIQTIAASFMCTSLLKMSNQLNLSDNLCSATLYSFGVATPCIFSAISGIMNKKPQIVIAALFGSASFITQLIIGSIFALVSFRVEVLTYLRDASFYLCLIVWILYIFIAKQQISPFDAYGFLVLYAVYILFAFLTPREQVAKEGGMNGDIELPAIQSSVRTNDEDSNAKQRISKIFNTILNPINDEKWRNSDRIRKMILIIKFPILFIVRLTSPLIDHNETLEKLTPELRFNMFIQMILGPQLILEAVSLNRNAIIEAIPVSIVVLIASIFVALFFYYFVRSPRLFEIFISWHSFVLSVFWVYLVCDETVSLLRALSIKLNLTEEIIGLTILAWGNASLDLFADIKIVFEGKPRLASSATIIAPFVSLVLGVGIPCSFLFLTQDIAYLPVKLSEQMVIMFISVTAGLVFTSLHLILNNFVACRFYGVLIILFYFLTIVLEFALEFRLWSLNLTHSAAQVL